MAFVNLVGMTQLFDDKSPKLGGDLDVNDFKIISSNNGNIIVMPDGTGNIQFQPEIDSTTFLQILDADGGTPILNVDSTNERIGIGTAAPAATLDVLGGTNLLRLNRTAYDPYVIRQSSGSGLEFYNNQDAVVELKLESGKVGIGDTSPSERLEVTGNIRLSDDNDLIQLGAAQDYTQTWDGSNAVHTVTAGDFVFTGGNVGVGTSTFDGSAQGTLAIANGTAPATGTANQSYIYARDVAASSEMHVMDEAGNETQISPHDPETGEWIFYSQNKKTGRRVRCNMDKLVKAVEKLTGEKFMIESLIGA